MQRELKFRAWDKEDKRMITHEQDFIPLKVCSLGVLRLNPTTEQESWHLLPIERFEVMQFTGLKDKNGKEIYEGDILKGGMYLRYIVMWNHEDCGWNIAPYGVTQYEVIGNIYEHKNLLDK